MNHRLLKDVYDMNIIIPDLLQLSFKTTDVRIQPYHSSLDTTSFHRHRQPVIFQHLKNAVATIYEIFRTESMSHRQVL